MVNGFPSAPRRVSAIFFLIALISSFSVLASTELQNFDVDAVPGELVIKLKAVRANSIGARSAQFIVQSSLDRTFGRDAVLSVEPFELDSNYQLVRLKNQDDVIRAVNTLSFDSDIEFAEPNFIYRASVVRNPEVEQRALSAVPADPSFSKLWGVFNNGQKDPVDSKGRGGVLGTKGVDVNVMPLWEKGFVGDREIVVAIIDTGIKWNHEDIASNLYTNPGEAGDLSENGIDDDGNGFVDDVHGWNFVANTRDSNDDDLAGGHGTHCAGTIGATGDNKIGITGVNWKVSLLPLKFLGADGSGNLKSAISAIQYATMMKVDVMNNSWGGGGFSQLLLDVIEEADQAGILFVAAAGNEGTNNDVGSHYPSNYDVPNVVSVGAIDNRGRLAKFSNYGVETVDVVAPGVRIYSTVNNGKYTSFSGTSMATPHVSGVAALLMSINKGWSYQEVKQRLMGNNTPIYGLDVRVKSQGRVDAMAAYGKEAPTPLSPWLKVAGDVESLHPYENYKVYRFTIKEPGAKLMRVRFSRIDVELEYDSLEILGKDGKAVQLIAGKHKNYISEYVEGDELTIKMITDFTKTFYGFSVDQYQYVK